MVKDFISLDVLASANAPNDVTRGENVVQQNCHEIDTKPRALTGGLNR
jgi:hypothetical protein